MPPAILLSSAALVLLLLAPMAPASAQTLPVDVLDPRPREVLVQLEESSDLAVVGQVFGPPFPAAYAVNGNTGTVTISVETHETMRSGLLGMLPVPGSFTPIVIEIDLTTLEATSPPASGALENPPLSFDFTQNTLDTTATLGFVGPNTAPVACTSQQQIDDVCALFGIFCGKVCTLVPGSGYDPVRGELNLVGSETQVGCDGAPCDPPIDVFTGRGDLRLSEVTPVPSLSPVGGLTLLLALLAASALGLRGGPGVRAARRR